jgi:uncharacterized protein (TIGR02246 family)
VIGASSPAEIHILFQDAFNHGDLETLGSLYEPDAVLMAGGQRVVGRENIKAAFSSLIGAGVQMNLITRVVMEMPHGLALLHGEWIVRRPPAPEPESSTRGISAEVVRMQSDGTWRFVIDNPYTPEFDS